MVKLLGISIFLSCLFLSAKSLTYGTKASGSDITKSLAGAWAAACKSKTASKVLIPSGTYTLREAVLKGPCNAPIELEVQGTVKASREPATIKTGNEWITLQYLQNFTLSGNGVFDGQGAFAWHKSNRCTTPNSCNKFPNNFALDFVSHSTIKGITSKDSKLFHFVVFQSHNLTFSNITISAPENSPNTDGIHIGRSKQITVAESTIKTGDECVSIGDGSEDIKLTGVNCGPGRGISVGSLGRYPNEKPVKGIYVNHTTLTNTTFGVRIKTWAASHPGSASDMHFENIGMDNVRTPVLIDQLHCPSFPCKANITPSAVKISNVSFKGIRGTSPTPNVVSLICSKSAPCEGVEIGDIHLKYTGTRGKVRSNCANVKPTFSGTQNPPICATAPQSS